MNCIPLDHRRPHTLMEARVFTLIQTWYKDDSPTNGMILVGMVNDCLVFYLPVLDARAVITFQPDSDSVICGKFTLNKTNRGLG